MWSVRNNGEGDLMQNGLGEYGEYEEGGYRGEDKGGDEEEDDLDKRKGTKKKPKVRAMLTNIDDLTVNFFPKNIAPS